MRTWSPIICLMRMIRLSSNRPCVWEWEGELCNRSNRTANPWSFPPTLFSNYYEQQWKRLRYTSIRQSMTSTSQYQSWPLQSSIGSWRVWWNNKRRQTQIVDELTHSTPLDPDDYPDSSSGFLFFQNAFFLPSHRGLLLVPYVIPWYFWPREPICKK